jgi:hypothetical protein
MSHHVQAPAAPTTRRRPVQIAALIFAIAFLAIGVLGFIPGITTDGLGVAGHESHAMLLGVFQVSVLHNAVHVAFGLVGLWLATHPRTASAYLLWGGLAYAMLWLYGLAIDLNGPANLVPLNEADNWLHLGLAVVMVVLGIVLPRRGVTEPTPVP